MHPLAYDRLKKILEEIEVVKNKKLVGPDETCDYYHCHFIGQDCTWCFCPFYPCEDEQTGGKCVEKRGGGRIWDCSGCYWIHNVEVAEELLESFRRYGIENVDDIIERKEELNEIFSALKAIYPPVRQQRPI